MLLDGKFLRFFPVCTISLRMLLPEEKTLSLLSGSTLMPLKFASHRWLEKVPVCQKALMLLDSVAEHVKATEDGRVNRPKKDPMKLSRSVLKTHALWLRYTSSSALQISCNHFSWYHFLSDDLCMIIRSLMKRFIKSDILQDASDEQLVKIKVAEQNLHVNNKRVDVGFASENLKGTVIYKPSDLVTEFKMESKTCLIQLLVKMLEKCPVSYSLVKHLSCLNPVKMASNKEACSEKFKEVLRLLVNADRVKEEECDILLQQFAMFLDKSFQFLGWKDLLTSNQL